MKKLLKFGVSIPLLAVSIAALGVTTTADVGTYYSSITNTSSGSTLASSLHTLLGDTHTTTLSYSGLWTAYATSDCLPGTDIIWDIYSEYNYECGGSKQGVNYSNEGDSYNREHTVPQSWFNEAKPMVADVVHVYPTDGKVNGIRSNYVYGEVSSPSYTAGNGGMLGTSALSGYSGTVFEPIDEYKGDIARSYFYMAIRYSNVLGNWTGGEAQEIFSSSYPYLTDYALDLFTKWSHEDPVSDKENLRNDSFQTLQGLRNPFIDYPEWIDTIWSNSYTDTATNTAYSASDVVSAINSLTSTSSDDTIYTVYQKFCRLNTTDKPSVSNYSTLVSYVEGITSTDINQYWDDIVNADVSVDQDAVDNVIALITALPSTITLDNETAVNAANTAYQALNSAEKALVTNYSKLSAALAMIEELEALANQSEEFTLVTSVSDLSVGDTIVIAALDYDYGLGAATSNTYYRTGEAITKGTNTMTYDTTGGIVPLTLGEGTTSGTYSFYTGSVYLYASSSSYADLQEEATLSANSSWSISIDSTGAATITSQGSYTYNIIQYYSSSTQFRCYTSTGASGYSDVVLYRYREDTTLDQDAVDNVIALINALPASISLSDEADIEAAETAYAALNSIEKAAVTNYSTLTAARTSLDTLLGYISTFKGLSTKSSMKFSYTSTTTGSGSTSYNLVDSVSDLSDGDVVVIAAVGADYAMGALSNNVSTNVSITRSESTLSSIGSALLFTLEATGTTNVYYLRTSNGYLSSTTIKKLAWVESSSDASTWTISVGTNGYAAVVTNDTYSLQYNSSSPRFTTYTSSQTAIQFYERTAGETTTYEYSNMYLRYGAGMEADLYNELVSLGSSVSFGIALSIDNSTFTNYTCTPARVASIGAIDTSTTGNYYQYSVLFNVPSTNYSTVVYAKAYVEIDGTKYYMNSASYSVKTLAEYYETNASTLSISDDAVGALGGLQ